MNHICQRGFYDCGIAVAAMLTDKTYEDVESALVKAISLGLIDEDAKTYGLTFDDMRILLENYLTRRFWRFVITKGQKEQGRSAKDIAAQYLGYRVGMALADPNGNPGQGHIIGSENSVIYDPRPIYSGAVRVETFEFKDALVDYFFYQEH